MIGQVVTNPKFLYSAFSAFSAYDAYAFFEDLGVPLKVERGNRVFPLSDRASDVRDALKRRLIDAGVQIIEDQITKIGAGPVSAGGKERALYLRSADSGNRRIILSADRLHRRWTPVCRIFGTFCYKPEPALGPLARAGESLRHPGRAYAEKCTAHNVWM